MGGKGREQIPRGIMSILLKVKGIRDFSIESPNSFFYRMIRNGRAFEMPTPARGGALSPPGTPPIGGVWGRVVKH